MRHTATPAPSHLGRRFSAPRRGTSTLCVAATVGTVTFSVLYELTEGEAACWDDPVGSADECRVVEVLQRAQCEGSAVWVPATLPHRYHMELLSHALPY